VGAYEDMEKEKITIKDLEKIDIKIGKVIEAGKVEGTNRLIKLKVDLGKEKRQIVTAMAEFFEPEYFIGKEISIVLNIEKKFFKGVESNGMILSADFDGKPILITPEKSIPPGSSVL